MVGGPQPWLGLAHEKLDRAVLDAYGWQHDISDEDILARLLEENLKREAVERRNAEGATAENEEDSETQPKPKKRKEKRKA